MTDRPQPHPRWTRLANQALITAAFALIVVWSAWSFGRSVVFAFGVNWVLMIWAIMLGHISPLRLPAGYYVIRRFERGGRLYDYLGVRRYRRLLRRCLWSVNPARLRSEPGARETMMRATYDPETGHLLIFIVISGITLWASASGWWDTVAWLLLFNLAHNGYPVLSMRQLRARLKRRSGATGQTANGANHIH